MTLFPDMNKGQGTEIPSQDFLGEKIIIQVETVCPVFIHLREKRPIFFLILVSFFLLPQLKRELCMHSPGRAELLRKINNPICFIPGRVRTGNRILL